MMMTIVSENIHNDDIIKHLEGLPGWETHDIQLSIERKKYASRSLDPTLLTALISAGSAALGALITGLLSLAKQSKTQKIVIRDKNGIIAEFPADFPTDKIKTIIEKINDTYNEENNVIELI